MRFTVGPVDTMWSVGFLNRNKAEITITSRTLCDQRRIPDAEGRMVSVDNAIFIHAVVPGHVETVVLLRRKNIDDHLEFTWTDEEFGKKKGALS